MKKVLFILIAFLTLTVSNSNALGFKIRIPVKQSVKFVANLPDSSYYNIEDVGHVDLGYIEVHDFRTLVLYSKDQTDTYYDIYGDYVDLIKRDMKVDDIKSLLPEKSFFQKNMYEILGIIIIIISVIFSIRRYIKILLKRKREQASDNEDDD